MLEITLYFAPRSRSLRALWLLEEIGAPSSSCRSCSTAATTRLRRSCG